MSLLGRESSRGDNILSARGRQESSPLPPRRLRRDSASWLSAGQMFPNHKAAGASGTSELLLRLAALSLLGSVAENMLSGNPRGNPYGCR